MEKKKAKKKLRRIAKRVTHSPDSLTAVVALLSASSDIVPRLVRAFS